MPLSHHPIIGSWIVTFPDEPGVGLSVNSFTTDGIVIQAHPIRHGHGAWKATGEQTAVMTLVVLLPDSAPTAGSVTVRANLEIDATGNAYSGIFTNESIGLDGSSSGQRGPFKVAGSRIQVETTAIDDAPANA